MTTESTEAVQAADLGDEGLKPKKKRAAEAAVKLDGLVKRFGSKAAVDGVTFSVKQGSVFGLIGPNGAGKTTTFSMLAGFLKPTGGSVEVLGYRPSQVDSLRGRLGVLPQDAILPTADYVGEFLVHMARLQNIPSRAAEELAQQALSDVGGSEWWKMRCSALSHGMAKRVSVAQAFLGEPEVVLLDEPTAGLDPRVAYEVRQYVKSKRKKCTIIISSHNLHELEEICDAAAILDRGKLIVTGSMASLTASNHEVRIKVQPPSVEGVSPATKSPSLRPTPSSEWLPMDALRAVPHVTQVSHEPSDQELVVTFDRRSTDAETVIAHVLWILLNSQVRISAVSKGRGLEQRVMDLTE